LTGFAAKLQKAKLEELAEIEGIGDKVAQSVYDYFNDENNLDQLKKLDQLGVIPAKENLRRANATILNKTFVLTGSLQTMSREEAKELIQNSGGKVSSSVSAKTNFVVAGNDPGSKFTKAQKLGVKIISEKEFGRLLKS
jgi:DNA ligase (NAD+)